MAEKVNQLSTVPIPDKLYFKIGEVSKITSVEPYILRYWESEFKLVKPYRTRSNQRLYRKKDVETILKIRQMLYEQKFTIAGAKKVLKKNCSQPQQLSLDFSSERNALMLKEIRDELKALCDMLS